MISNTAREQCLECISRIAQKLEYKRKCKPNLERLIHLHIWLPAHERFCLAPHTITKQRVLAVILLCMPSLFASFSAPSRYRLSQTRRAFSCALRSSTSP